MSEDRKYNGWSNYATWRINLEVFDDHYSLAEQYKDIESVYDLSKLLQEYMDEILESELAVRAKNSLVFDYASAFISEVNYYEIAEHIWEEIQRNAKKQIEEEIEEEIEETIEETIEE